MVDPKVAVVVLAALGTGAALVLRGAEAPPVEEGAPEGEVTLEITPQGRPQGFGVEDVQGAWGGVGTTLKVTGRATAGFPVPSMVLEIYDNNVLRKTRTITSITLNTSYDLSDTMGSADSGDHVIYGRMVLTNELGSFEFVTASQDVSIGEELTGEVSLEITLA